MEGEFGVIMVFHHYPPYKDQVTSELIHAV